MRIAARKKITPPIKNNRRPGIAVQRMGHESHDPATPTTMPRKATIVPIITPRGGGLPDGLIATI